MVRASDEMFQSAPFLSVKLSIFTPNYFCSLAAISFALSSDWKFQSMENLLLSFLEWVVAPAASLGKLSGRLIAFSASVFVTMEYKAAIPVCGMAFVFFVTAGSIPAPFLFVEYRNGKETAEKANGSRAKTFSEQK